MKRFILTITSLILILTLISTCFIGSYAASNFTTGSQFNNHTYTHYGVFAGKKIKDMIDVSEHNGLINWYKVKALGIDEAIIRLGYRGYGKAGNMAEDAYFYDNMDAAIAAGVKVGVYFYSQSLNTQEAIDEANFCLKRVKGYTLNLPIYFDYEFAEVSDGRLDSAWYSGKINKNIMTANVIAFCDTIKKSGYKAGLYSSPSFYTGQYDADKFLPKGYEFWLAYYTYDSTKGNYWSNRNPVYRYWQYSGENVQGVCGASQTHWLQVKYGSTTGYVVSSGVDFIGATQAAAFGELNLRAGAGTGNKILTTIPKGGKMTVLSYPTDTRTDVNFSYAPAAFKPEFTLSADSGSITVSWEEVEDAAYYRVYTYNTETGKYDRIAQTKELSYTLTGLAKGTEKTLLVRCFNESGTGSKYSKKDNQTIMTALAKPAFSLKEKTDSTLTVTWKNVKNTAYYRVYSYNAQTKKYERLAQVKTNTFTIGKLSGGTDYSILVRAFNTCGVGSDYTVKDNQTYSTLPSAPQFGFTRYSYAIKVVWKPVTGAAFYRVYQFNEKTRKYTTLAKTADTSWTQEGLKGGTAYTFIVRAFNAKGEGSSYTFEQNRTVTTRLRKPQFTLSLTEENAIKAEWKAIPGAAFYRVYTYDAETKQYQRIAQTKNLSFVYENAACGKEHSILVRAFDSASDGSSYSVGNHKTITTPIDKATFMLSSDVAGTVTVTWEPVKDAAYYRVYSYNTATNKYTRLVTLQNGELSYTVSKLKSGTEYSFLVRAFSATYLAADSSVADNESIVVK